MLISVIVPCRNEVDHVDAFMHSVLAQQLPAELGLQIVVGDGASDDGTRERLAAWAVREPRLLVVDNPKHITSAALNLAIAASRGEIIVRMDVHTEYAPDYIAQCVAVLQQTGATCVGGAWLPVGQGGRQGAIALAFQSRFGSGGAASRRAAYTGPADTVYLGAWRRAELLRFGGFDETLVRNQDDELNLRILRGGGRVWQSAAIRSAYVPRASFTALFRQFYQYGYWKVPVIRKHRLPAAPRHVLPFLFITLMLVLAVLGLARVEGWWALATVVGIYAVVALVNALLLAPRQAAGVAWAFACMHAGYGLGFGRGLIDFGLLRRAPGAAVTRLTR